MIITFFFNYLNHHQVLVADEMYKLLGDNFRFVATFPRNPDELKGGKDYSDRPYCILAGESATANARAHEYNKISDICVFGAAHLEWMRERAETGKLSFEVSERWLKKGWMNVLSPRLLNWWWLYQTTLKNKPFYKLCASAFAAQDDEKLGCYRNRHFKWGYFTKVSDQLPNCFEEDRRGSHDPIRIMWCARFLKLKHPELPVLMAARLKENGYSFVLDYYGDGEELEPTKQKTASLGLEGNVNFHGAVPNEQVLDAMRQHEIFLFTSNRLEGWGAVVNEAMSSGCVIVASDVIGSVPYLIEDGVTGWQYKDGSVDSLFAKVKWLLDHPGERLQMQKNAYGIMQKLWSPANAAKSLLQLIQDLQNGKGSSITEGPCSEA